MESLGRKLKMIKKDSDFILEHYLEADSLLQQIALPYLFRLSPLL